MIRPAQAFGTDASLVEVAPGVSLSVTDLGEGLPLMLLHGVSMSAAYFHSVIDPLVEAGYRVVVPDLRGHGRSPAVEGGHTVGQYADDINALLDALGIDRCVLVGWSMGNLVAWELMHRHGRERVLAHINISQGPTDLQTEDFPDAPLSIEAIHGFVAGCQADYRGSMEHFAPVMFKDDLSAEDLARNSATCSRAPTRSISTTASASSASSIFDHGSVPALTLGRRKSVWLGTNPPPGRALSMS